MGSARPELFSALLTGWKTSWWQPVMVAGTVRAEVPSAGAPTVVPPPPQPHDAPPRSAHRGAETSPQPVTGVQPSSVCWSATPVIRCTEPAGTAVAGLTSATILVVTGSAAAAGGALATASAGAASAPVSFMCAPSGWGS
ncbi:hypothetical protein [Actinosynnema pretiosum]|uniref:Uncharacterized protein n=1 Tax=Actinosynnema pretiosum TaxID=42197 RepID=A0A290Z3Q4_9PSEU|nr:hypothetical protein [Actinosynnema pretiosum]ATE53660.1 hypothetical protein CNX65_10460 [Actinosynnema pretiosum]